VDLKKTIKKQSCGRWTEECENWIFADCLHHLRLRRQEEIHLLHTCQHQIRMCCDGFLSGDQCATANSAPLKSGAFRVVSGVFDREIHNKENYLFIITQLCKLTAFEYLLSWNARLFRVFKKPKDIQFQWVVRGRRSQQTWQHAPSQNLISRISVKSGNSNTFPLFISSELIQSKQIMKLVTTIFVCFPLPCIFRLRWC